MRYLSKDNSDYTSFIPDNLALKVSDDRINAFRDIIDDLDDLSSHPITRILLSWIVTSLLLLQW